MYKNLKKEITFICTDKVERQCCEPIAEEAEKRGYKVKFTNNKFEKCEIGFYVSHLNYPQNSKFSVVTLHDLGQQHGEWPNMWKNEFWNQFDVGLLPSKEWADMWHNASCYDFARPNLGCYLTGWIKADKILNQNFDLENEKITQELNIDTTKPTVLYAPSWEWDNRELEIVNAVNEMNINLIIKQFPATPEVFPEQYKIINEVHSKVRNLNRKNVYILDSTINIFNCIALCDVLVSEESSTLYEAMLFGKPVIAVDDWMVPDIIPPRFPDFPYTWAVHTKKENLKNTINDVLLSKSYRDNVIAFRDSNFPNIGHAALSVMNIIDKLVFNKSIEIKPIEALELKKTPASYKKSVKIRKQILRRYAFRIKYVKKIKILNLLYKIYRKVKYR